jgi:hypothetical protein
MRSDPSRQFSLFDLFGGEIVPAPAPRPAVRCQRWRDGRHSYRPAGEPINTRLYEVAEIDRATAKRFVVAHHYARSFPAPRWHFGLYRGPALVGVAVFSRPQHQAVLTNVFPGDWEESTELGRFVLLNDVPANGETWFLARIFELLCPLKKGRPEPRVRGIVSFSDPVPRLALDGHEVMPGHLGTIYQAANALYLGRGRAKTLDLFPDGTPFNRRALTKLLAGHKGRSYAARLLEAHGGPPLRGDARAYVEAWLPRLTRSIPHPGNHRYVWAFNRADQRRLERLSRELAQPLARPLPYPKRLETIS